MPKALDLTNQRFGKLVAIQKAPSRSGKTYWLCQCDCGQQKEVQTGHLTSSAIKSCGCSAHDKKREQPVVAFRKRIKIALVEAFSHQCCACGLKDDAVLYDFHHLNPEEKEFGIGNTTTTRSRQSYADEAKKCIMLCSNCHRRIENNLINVNGIDIISFDEEKYYQTLEELLQ